MKARLCGFLGLALLLLAGSPRDAHADFNPFSGYWNNIARAAAQNDVAKVRAALLDGNSPNQVDESNRTGLHIAAINGNLQIAAILIKAGATIDQKDTVGNTALHYAADRDHLEMLKLLIDVGAKVDAENRNGMTPLMLAARAGEIEEVRVLLARGANPNKTDFTGRDAASWATEGHRPAVVAALKQAATRK